MADEHTPDDDFTDAAPSAADATDAPSGSVAGDVTPEAVPSPTDVEPAEVSVVAEVPVADVAVEEAPVRSVADEETLLFGETSAAAVAPPVAATQRAASAETSASVRAEQARLRAEREARRAAREAALRPAPERVDPVALARTEEEAPEEAPLPDVRERVVTRRSTDGFMPSFALFLLRLVVAAILGIRGVGVLLDLGAATQLISTTILPAPQVLAIVLGVAEVVVALALVFGFMTRIAGLGVMLIAGSALAFVLWGPWSPFVAGQPGFTGELELLLTAVGFLFLGVGGGGWGLDHGFRMRRAANRSRESY